jgi:hypothetical protein
MSGSWLEQIAAIIGSVAIGVTPLILLFLLFQVFLLKLPLRQVADILKGTAIAMVGLCLFLMGVAIAFLPFGRAIGAVLGALDNHLLFMIVGGLLGLATAWSEPGVRILANQVEEASNGAIRSTIVLYAVCVGVAVWVGIGMLRIAYGLPLLYLLVPGYGAVLVMTWFSRTEFVAIAADAGGVATGPLANSFLLALALGASSAVAGQDPVVNGFGLVALIALAPIMSVTLVGVLVELKARKQESKK